MKKAVNISLADADFVLPVLEFKLVALVRRRAARENRSGKASDNR